MISVQVSGLDRLTRRMKTLQDQAFVKAGVSAVATELVGIFRTPPPQASLTRTQVYGQPFQSDKQRRYFFWALKQGIIEVPYTRESSPGSQRMLAGWSVVSADNGFTAIIGNSANLYNTIVMGIDQSKFMKAIGWERVVDIVAREWPRLNRVMADTVNVYLKANP